MLNLVPLVIGNTNFYVDSGRLKHCRGNVPALSILVGELQPALGLIGHALEHYRNASRRRFRAERLCGQCSIEAFNSVAVTVGEIASKFPVGSGCFDMRQWEIYAEEVIACDSPGALWNLTHHLNLPFKAEQLRLYETWRHTHGGQT